MRWHRTVRSQRVLTHNVPSPFFTGPLRSPLRLQNTFAHEWFMDEIARAVKADPVEYRLRHLSDEPRLCDVVKAAAKAADWQPRPSPSQRFADRRVVAAAASRACIRRRQRLRRAGCRGRSRSSDAGKSMRRRWSSPTTAGPISNPEGLRNQIEGGLLQGMSRALGEEVTWDDHKVTSVDWRSYHSLSLGIELPQIEIVLIDRPNDPATGAGETAITLVAGAIGNAIFDATGARLREVPFTPERVKVSMKSRAWITTVA